MLITKSEALGPPTMPKPSEVAYVGWCVFRYTDAVIKTKLFCYSSI